MILLSALGFLHCFLALSTEVTLDPEVKKFLANDLAELRDDAIKRFVTLKDEEEASPANSIFRRWLEMRHESEEGHFLPYIAQREESLRSLNIVQLCGMDSATFLTEFYEWWKEATSFIACVEALLPVVRTIKDIEADFKKATDELAPCFRYMQYYAGERNGKTFKAFAELLRQCEAKGVEFSPVAKEFLFTVPKIENDSIPLVCVDPRFCVWDRDSYPGVNYSRERLEKYHRDLLVINNNSKQRFILAKTTLNGQAKQPNKTG